MKTTEYLAAVKAATETGSDYAAAKLLRVERQTVSGWVRGVYFPDVLACYAIAKVLGLDPARVVADIEAERAERAGKVEQAARWREWIATAAAVILSVWTGVHPDAGAQAAPLERAASWTSDQRLSNLYIVALARRLSSNLMRAARHALAAFVTPAAAPHLSAVSAA